ncbi:MAG: serine dehydrogenasease [Sulfobacillus acidophilus]|uniref:Serine dehydrogenasease n=1 Tax=Sulfobacillus acidophilus TaxID=53633 RepID=A0A2T2WLW2_9FIRM|nr:MAG: serine dehydrogenasease [Sulfobacillus acidophilus]
MEESLALNANEYIERQLDKLNAHLGEVFRSDVLALALNGPLAYGVDDVIHSSVETFKDKSPTLSVVITTDGGYVEVVQRIAETIRHHYNEVNFIIPNHAFSAGTILAMSGDSIFMDYYSRLGPIDPQVRSSNGQMVPALGYLIQWEKLLKKAEEGTITVPEVQLMVDGFDVAELYHYEQARELSVALLKEWLVKYKFKQWTYTETTGTVVTKEMKEQRAEEIALKLNDPSRWHSHGSGISMEVLETEVKLKIEDFGQEPKKGAVVNYHSLMQDYMDKLGHAGAVHFYGQYIPYLTGR